MMEGDSDEFITFSLFTKHKTNAHFDFSPASVKCQVASKKITNYISS